LVAEHFLSNVGSNKEFASALSFEECKDDEKKKRQKGHKYRDVIDNDEQNGNS